MAASGSNDQLPDYANQGERLQTLTNVGFAFLVISWIVVAMRVYVRAFMIRAFLWDDWTMIFALFLFTGYVATFEMLKRVQTSPQATAALDEGLLAQLEIVKDVMKWVVASYGFYLSLCVVLKISVAISYLRIVVKRWQRLTIYIATAIYSAFGMAFCFVAIFQCGNPSNFVIGQIEGKCLKPDVVLPLNYVASVLNITSDWIFVGIPIIVVWQSRMPKVTKLSAAVLLSLGAVSSISSIVRLRYIPGLRPGREFLHTSVSTGIWSAVETGLAIIAISLSTLRPLFKSVLGGSSAQSGSYTDRPTTAGRTATLTANTRTLQDRQIDDLYRISDDDLCGMKTTIVGNEIKMKEIATRVEEFEVDDKEKSLRRENSEERLVSPQEMPSDGIMATTEFVVSHERQF